MNNGNSERPKKNRAGSVEEILLLSLENRELYGLQIVEVIKKASDGKIVIGMGSLYSTLHTLEKKGLVTSRWGDERLEERLGARRKYYK